MLNNICKDCLFLGRDCDGTTNTVWTGCVFRKAASKEELSSHIPVISREAMLERGVLISKIKEGLDHDKA